MQSQSGPQGKLTKAATKKPRAKPGLLSCPHAGRRSVLRNHRAAPVEAVDQRRADGLGPGLEGDVVTGGEVGAVGELSDVLATVIGGAIFGLHEPAGRRDSEDVQVVLDTAADEGAAAVKRIGVGPPRKAAKRVQQSRTRPVGTAITAIHIGEDVW